MSKVIQFEPASEDVRITSVTNGSLAMFFKGKPPWTCSAEDWPRLQRAAPGRFKKAAGAGQKKIDTQAKKEN